MLRSAVVTPLAPFVNEPILELRRASVRAELADALERLDQRLPIEVPVLGADGASAGSGASIESIDPGEPDRLVARAARASEDDAAQAIAEAQQGVATRRN